MQHESTPVHPLHETSATGVTGTTRKTMVLNAALSAIKVMFGTLGQSQVLIADGIHSLSDCMTDAAILLGVRYWSAPADERHPYGHWRLEALVTIGMGISLVAVAAGLMLRAWQSVRSATAATPAWYTLVAAILTLATKEAMFHWTRRKAGKYRSRALLANAWHQRSDALSSVPAVVAIATAMVFPGLPFIDPIGAVVVSFFIVAAAWHILSGATGELMDESLPPQILSQIETIVCAVPGVSSTHALRSRRNGPGYFLDLHVLVPGNLTVRESHQIAKEVRRTLMRESFRILDAVVHIEPDDA